MNFIKQILIVITLLLIVFVKASAQSAWVPYNSEYYHLVERYELLKGERNPVFHPTLRNWQRSDIGNWLDTLATDSGNYSNRDKFNLQYLATDNNEFVTQYNTSSKRPFLKVLYQNPADFASVRVPRFDVHAGPVIDFSTGNDNKIDGRTYQNTRGVELRGMVDSVVGWYFYLTENQARLPYFADQFVAKYSVVPGEAFWKAYNKTDIDYFSARGYVRVKLSKSITGSFGHHKHFIGDGYRSLVLSDFAPAFAFLRLDTKVWKIHYTNLFGQLKYDIASGYRIGTRANKYFPNKYMATHFLSINVGKKLTVGAYETVIFERTKYGQGDAFDLSYLNPIIFYRAVEQNLGSPDNVILGVTFNYLPFRKWMVYGQGVIDEFYSVAIKAQTGMHHNKHAAQLGIKTVDFLGIRNLDLQGEFNVVRPFTYSHYDSVATFSHYQQPLAHPLGANLIEFLGIIRYQPLKRLFLNATLIQTNYGADKANDPYGNNILIPYTERQREDGYFIGSGTAVNQQIADLNIRYMLKHNLFIELRHITRLRDVAGTANNSAFTQFRVSYNLNSPQYGL